jgi:endonuclease/exonuclease/phosphatase family metal-dependent hydrolase
MIKWLILAFFGAALSAGLWAWFAVYQPSDLERVPIHCSRDVPTLSPGQSVKVLNWNVQYMAGKDYFFFYEGGPDAQVEPEDIEATTAEVARVIRDENPDIVLLQEVYDGAVRTEYIDELARLRQQLPDEYACHSSAFYWRAPFVPHPRILGSVGMKLVVLSKYRIDDALRHQLTLKPADPITKHFGLRRAVQEVRLPVDGGLDFVALNTHLEAFAKGTGLMARHVQEIQAILQRIAGDGHPWLLGGDFNMLPPAPEAYERLQPSQRAFFNDDATEITPLFETYQPVPTLEELAGPDASAWFTHFPNDPAVGQPNKTIDYLFLPDHLPLGPHCVRQHDTLHISDHLPVIAELRLPD